MRKRLRKKKHLGEFIQYGFEIDGTWKEQGVYLIEQQDKFMDALIDFCEANDLACGGGGNADTFGFFITKVRRLKVWKPKNKYVNVSATGDDRKLMQDFLASRSELATFVVGELVDAWK